MLSLIDGPYPSEVKRLAGKVYVDLHHSAQKGGNGDHWRSCLVGIIAEFHMVLDRMFEFIEEGSISSYVNNLDRPRMPQSKGVGMKRLEDEYSVLVMTAMDRIQVLVGVMKEFLR